MTSWDPFQTSLSSKTFWKSALSDQQWFAFILHGWKWIHQLLAIEESVPIAYRSGPFLATRTQDIQTPENYLTSMSCILLCRFLMRKSCIWYILDLETNWWVSLKQSLKYSSCSSMLFSFCPFKFFLLPAFLAFQLQFILNS